MLFHKDSQLDLLLAVLGTFAILVWALEPVVRLVGPPWGTVLAIAAGWPTVANLLRYKRAPMGCAVVPTGLIFLLIAKVANLAPEVQAFALLIPNLPFYLWISLIKPLAERRGAVNALGQIDSSQDPALWARYLDHSTLAVRLAAAEALSGRPFGEVSGFLGAPLESKEAGVRGAAAQAIRALAKKEREAVALWLQTQAQASPAEGTPAGADELGLPAAGLLAELDPVRAEAVLEAKPSPGLSLAIGEGFLYRTKESESEDFGRAAALLVEVLGTSPTDGQRGDAYYLSARFSDESPALSAALVEALRQREGTPSVEELALLGELGSEGQDALRAARYTGQEDYDLASAAAEAVEAIATRAESLQPAESEVKSALAGARDEIRERHPAGENRLADQLVERLEGILSGALTA